MDQLTKTDLAIVSNSAYRTSVLIENKTFLDKLKEETINTSMEEDALLVTFIKSLRLNRVKEKEVYDKLKNDLLDFNLEKLHFKGLVHFFAYFSDGLWNDQEVCTIIIDECLKRLFETTDFIINDIRAKDVTTLLWSCANLGVEMELEDLEFMENIVNAKVRNNEFKYRADELVECCLSLWMLGLKSPQLMSEINSLDFSVFTSNNPIRSKLNSRMRLLLSCVEIEAPELLKRRLGKEKSFSESKPAPAYLLKSDNLRDVDEFLSDFKDEFQIKDKCFVAPIKDLNLAGILVKFNDDSKVYVEIVEENLMLKFEDKPSTLITLKKRLLESLGYNVILVSSFLFYFLFFLNKIYFQVTPNEYKNKDAFRTLVLTYIQNSKTAEAEMSTV